MVSRGSGLIRDDAGFQAECHNVTRAQLPDFLTGMPLATGLLHPLSSGAFRKVNTQGDYLVCWYTGGWWFPGPRGDDTLDRLAALFLLRIMPIAHTDETSAGLRASRLGPLPARLEMQRSPHANHLINASGIEQGQMRAEHNGSCSPVLAASPIGLGLSRLSLGRQPRYNTAAHGATPRSAAGLLTPCPPRLSTWVAKA